MKANDGNKIKIIEEVCYGTVYGLVKVEVGTLLTVAERNNSDDGIETEERVTLVNEIGEKSLQIHVWDSHYTIVQ